MLSLYEDATIPKLKNDINNLIDINQITKLSMSDLVLIRSIGEGGQSKVYEGYYGRNHVAIKILTNIDYRCLMSELVILSNLKHHSIPKFYGIVNEDKNLAIVTEYIKGKSLNSINMNEINFNTKLKIIFEIGNVLEYMHVNNIIHRDLKPENIMLDENYNTFLIDFGISKICKKFSKFVLDKAKGTLNYLAPESLEIKEITEKEEIVSIISTKTDVWAFGCLVSYILSGEIPWKNELKESDGLHEYKKLINNSEFPIPYCINRNEKLYDIIVLCTNTDPNHRLTMTEVNDILYDNYFLNKQEDEKAASSNQ